MTTELQVTATKIMSQVMKNILIAMVLLCTINLSVAAESTKSYKHAAQFITGILDETWELSNGQDATLGRSSTDNKISGGSQGVYYIHTDEGNYRVEAPLNSGMNILSAMAGYGDVYHNRWFMDYQKPGDEVLFARKCRKPNKKRPYETVSCDFWFADPYNLTHEFYTVGDFTPYMVGSHADRLAESLCGKGKLNAATEAQFCGRVLNNNPEK